MPCLVKYGLPIFIAIAILGALTKATVRPLKRQKAIEAAAISEALDQCGGTWPVQRGS